MVIYKTLIVVLICLSTMGIGPGPSFIYASNNDNENNVHYWFDWKIKHLDNDNQKKVIEYFEKINRLFEGAKKTEYETKESRWGHPNPTEAVRVVKNIIIDSKKIVPPKSCGKHYAITLKILYIIEEYQTERTRAGTDKMFEADRSRDEVYEARLREAKLDELRLEEEKQREYFRVLHKVGFYKNMLNEMVNLRLITKEQKEKIEKKSR